MQSQPPHDSSDGISLHVPPPSSPTPPPPSAAMFGQQQYTDEEESCIQNLLSRHLSSAEISHRSGPGGRKLAYLEANKVIDLANHIFSYHGWSTSIMDITQDYLEEKNNKYSVGLSCIIRVTLKNGCYHEDIGYGSCSNMPDRAQALDKAKKEAATDALKRALRLFGSGLGNCLADKEFMKKMESGQTDSEALDLNKPRKRVKTEHTAERNNANNKKENHPINQPNPSQQQPAQTEAYTHNAAVSKPTAGRPNPFAGTSTCSLSPPQQRSAVPTQLPTVSTADSNYSSSASRTLFGNTTNINTNNTNIPIHNRPVVPASLTLSSTAIVATTSSALQTFANSVPSTSVSNQSSSYVPYSSGTATTIAYTGSYSSAKAPSTMYASHTQPVYGGPINNTVATQVQSAGTVASYALASLSAAASTSSYSSSLSSSPSLSPHHSTSLNPNTNTIPATKFSSSTVSCNSNSSGSTVVSLANNSFNFQASQPQRPLTQLSTMKASILDRVSAPVNTGTSSSYLGTFNPTAAYNTTLVTTAPTFSNNTFILPQSPHGAASNEYPSQHHHQHPDRGGSNQPVSAEYNTNTNHHNHESIVKHEIPIRYSQDGDDALWPALIANEHATKQ